MQHEFLDQYSREDSPVHRLPPRLKVLVAGLLIVVSAVIPPGLLPLAEEVPISIAHLVLAFAVALGIQLAGIPWTYILVRLAAFAPLVLFMSLTVPLARGFESGWPVMAAVVAKGLLSFAIVLLLVNTTPFDRLLQALIRLRVPRVLVATLSFMYRYMFVLVDELTRMLRARQARTFNTGKLRRWLDTARLLSLLLLRSFERAERVHRAMLARGFDGTMRTLD